MRAFSYAMVTSGHVTKMAVIPFDPRVQKPHAYSTGKLHVFMFYRARVIADGNFTLRE